VDSVLRANDHALCMQRYIEIVAERGWSIENERRNKLNLQIQPRIEVGKRTNGDGQKIDCKFICGFGA